MTRKGLAVLVAIVMVFGLVPMTVGASDPPADGDVKTLGELEPGDIVVDASANWEFRPGANYTGEPVKTELIRWMVIKQDHFANGATLLLTEELVGRHRFDESNNVWADSELRAWLQGDGENDFFGNLSAYFQSAIVEATTVTDNLNNSDTVFILSATEMGKDPALIGDGTNVEMFKYNPSRVASFNDNAELYWLRTPSETGHVYLVYDGEFWTAHVSHTNCYVRPAVNFRSDAKVVYDGTEKVWVLVTGSTIPGYTHIVPMAAPNIAEIILANSGPDGEGVEANHTFGKGKNRQSLNFIKEVAHHMDSSKPTYFYCEESDAKYDDGLVPKSIWVSEGTEEAEYMNPDYWAAVLCFLNKLIDDTDWLNGENDLGLDGGYFTYSYGDYVDDLNGGNGGTGPVTLFEADFTGLGDDPNEVGEVAFPDGWYRDPTERWHINRSAFAGGNVPEMVFDAYSAFQGSAWLKSPLIDASSYTEIELAFQHDHAIPFGASSSHALKVKVSSDDGMTWATVWKVYPTASMISQTVSIDLSNYDGKMFYVAWVLEGGECPQWSHWFIDDIVLTGIPE